MTKVAAIVGPTASGKSEIAVEVALTLDAEIVSIDSMQAYRELDAGTAKPPAALHRRVRHHMIDVFDPEREVTVADFQETARATIVDISRRGRLPLLVGGSGLYFRAVVDDLKFPPRAPHVRARLEDEADRVGAEALHARLKELDPIAAARIEPSNARRTVRALEVIEITGRRFSENDSWERFESIYELAVAGLRRERDELDRRIDERVAQMLGSGLVVEARRLAGTMARTARQALGYRQILEAPEDVDEAELRAAIAQATRRFARRQESWFKADPRVVWFDAARPDLVAALVAHFRDALRVA